jgi:beta-galactosidase
MSDQLLACYRAEKDAIRAVDATTPVTTNFMGIYQPIDYHRWAPHLDLASWDNYPPGTREHARMALAHDLMRGLKDGAPFWLMEQTPTITASRDVNPVKRPGVMRLWTWQAVAHGADAALFFQMRQSRGACEKYHGAVLDHAGRTDTRAFQEVAGLGAELATLGDAVLGARTPARVALVFDWDSWWAVEMTDGFNRHVSYVHTVLQYYRALWQANVGVDVVPVTADLSGYDVVVAPLLHLLKGDVAARLEDVARRGGSVVSTFYAGRVDEDDNAFLMDAPGPLGALFGLRVDETDSAEPGVANPVTLRSAGSAADGDPEVVSDAGLVFEVVVPQGAQVVGTYGSDFYAGTPAVTRNAFGSGDGWYVATALDDAGVAWVVGQVLDRHGLVGPYADVPDLEVAVRERDGVRTAFLLHHGTEAVEVPAYTSGTDLLTGREVRDGDPLHLKPTDVVVLRERP